ncbi:MAG: hypothetical protein ACRC6A_10300 [Fusobacteriaceae bacterium]
MQERDIRIAARVNKEEYTELKSMAEINGVAMSEIIRYALKQLKLNGGSINERN